MVYPIAKNTAVLPLLLAGLKIYSEKFLLSPCAKAVSHGIGLEIFTNLHRQFACCG